MVLIGKLTAISSRANKTPPMGLPKATATPAALAAVTISRIFAWEREKRWKECPTTFPMAQAT